MPQKGIPVSPGIAVEKIHIHAPAERKILPERFLGDFAEQLKRLDLALNASKDELLALVDSISQRDPGQAGIFNAHIELLEDEDILSELRFAVEEDRYVPEYAVYSIYTEFAKLLSQSPDPNIALRGADLLDLRERLLRLLCGEENRGLSSLPGPVIIVAQDLLPSETATLDLVNTKGIITAQGGASSHTAILASALGIPAVVGVSGIPDDLLGATTVGLDAVSGLVYLDPDEKTTAALLLKKEQFLSRRDRELEFLSRPCHTADGVYIATGINVGSPGSKDDYEHCDFVGLFRTEFLYMESAAAPSEEEQFVAYRRILENAGGKSVVLRTLDIGGDKTLEYLSLPREENPALGIRGLRLCLAMPELFHIQLRAALRASIYGDLWIMLPMASGPQDIEKGRMALETAKSELIARGEQFNPDIKFGIMIEVPSVALCAELVANAVDFASIGTNDLGQYLFAADRQNPRASEYCKSFSPAMTGLISRVAKAFSNAGKPLSVCGEMAGDPMGATLLAGLGIHRLSMSPSKLASVRAALSGLTLGQLEDAANAALEAKTEEEVHAIYDGLLK